MLCNYPEGCNCGATEHNNLQRALDAAEEKIKELENTTSIERTYKVARHGGRSNCNWKIHYEGTDLNKAQEIYNKHYIKIRQGSLVLVEIDETGNNKILKREDSGMNRTRW